MSLLVPEVVTDNSNELLFHSIRTFQIESTASSGESGTTAFNGNFGCEPQVSASTIWFSHAGIRMVIYNVTEPSFARTATLSTFQFLKRSNAIFSVMKMEESPSVALFRSLERPFAGPSPPLSESELLDLTESEIELERGRGKRFKDPKTLLEDLDS